MRTLTIFAVALLASSAALAQPMGGGQGGGMMGGGMMGGGGHCMMMQRTEGALAFLKTELKIASSQEKAWNDFAEAYRDAAGGDHEEHGKKQGDHKAHGKHGKAESFPDKAKHHIEMMDMHHAGFKKVYDAAKPLYEALDTDQRKTADELLMHFLMPRHRGMQHAEGAN
jgi:hypothetical protein